MLVDEFVSIDINAPWLMPLYHIHHALANDIQHKNYNHNTPLYQWLNAYFLANNLELKNSRNKALTFTHQNDLPHGTAYEQYIGEYHKIPTRNNLHDWFNACIWSIFPQSKSLLNNKHLSYIHHNSNDNKRHRTRDTITVFDENGAVLAIKQSQIGKDIATALQNFDWQTCLIHHRQYWHNQHIACNQNNNTHAQLFIFGHALLEQLITPRKPLCSHTVIIVMPDEFFECNTPLKLTLLDNALATYLQHFLIDTISPKQLQPLPILGVPYFWADNQHAEFYQDTFVFRNGRRQSS
ncbi:MAG: DUF3025 domain-containing protein [Moraxella sp.]|nr:DUF3025 domain-containing protein [Moraxella sp.]